MIVAGEGLASVASSLKLPTVTRSNLNSNVNLEDVKDMAVAMELLKTGALNLPGGGTIELTENGVDIKGSVDLVKLEKWSVATRGCFNLRGLSSYYGTQDSNGISIITIKGNGFNKSQSQTEDLVGGPDKLPAVEQIALVLFAIQFLPEFQEKYIKYDAVAVRARSGFVAYALALSTGVDKDIVTNGHDHVGAITLSSPN